MPRLLHYGRVSGRLCAADSLLGWTVLVGLGSGGAPEPPVTPDVYAGYRRAMYNDDCRITERPPSCGQAK